VMWACDYPHPDSTWPDSKQAIARDMGTMERDEVRKITSDNCRALYGFD
jgi:predicted TIM-barrel fold metal-dependent hydrolase